MINFIIDLFTKPYILWTILDRLYLGLIIFVTFVLGTFIYFFITLVMYPYFKTEICSNCGKRRFARNMDERLVSTAMYGNNHNYKYVCKYCIKKEEK